MFFEKLECGLDCKLRTSHRSFFYVLVYVHSYHDGRFSSHHYYGYAWVTCMYMCIDIVVIVAVPMRRVEKNSLVEDSPWRRKFTAVAATAETAHYTVAKCKPKVLVIILWRHVEAESLDCSTWKNPSNVSIIQAIWTRNYLSCSMHEMSRHVHIGDLQNATTTWKDVRSDGIKIMLMPVLLSSETPERL